MNNQNRKTLPGIILALSILAVAGTAWLSREPAVQEAQAVQRAPSASPYSAIAKGRIDIKGGLLRLTARREGAISRVLVEEGDHVKAGQPLVQLDDQQARVALDLARSELEQARRAIPALEAKRIAAEREEARLMPLTSDYSVSRQEADQAGDLVRMTKAEIAAANAAIETAALRVKAAELDLDQRILRAPGEGQVMSVQAHMGDFVGPQSVLFLFAPNIPRVVVAELEERFVPEVKPGQSAEVILEADESHKFPAKVLRLGRMVGARTPSDDPHERQDDHVVECLLSIEAPQLLIGQRVIVRILK